MKKINNKGFTLVELLAVLVILVAIMGIAIPTISSSLERTKAKQNEARYKILESAAEQYVTDNKNAIYNNLDTNDDGKIDDDDTSKGMCLIEISELSEYLSSDEMKDADGEDLSGYNIIFAIPNNYKFDKDNSKKYEKNGTTYTVSTSCN